MRSLSEELTNLEEMVEELHSSFLSICQIKCTKCQADYSKLRHRQFRQNRYSVCGGSHYLCKICYNELIKEDPSYFLANKCSFCMNSYKPKENMAQIPLNKIRLEKKLLNFCQKIIKEIINIRDYHSSSCMVSYALEDSVLMNSSILSQLPAKSNIEKQENQKRQSVKQKLQRQKWQFIQNLTDDLHNQNRQFKKKLSDEQDLAYTYLSEYQKVLGKNAQQLSKNQKDANLREQKLKYQIIILKKQQVFDKLKLLKFEAKDKQNLNKIARLDDQIKSLQPKIEQSNNIKQNEPLRLNYQQNNKIAQQYQSISKRGSQQPNIKQTQENKPNELKVNDPNKIIHKDNGNRKSEVVVSYSIPYYLKQKLCVLISETIINLLLLVIIVQNQDQAQKLQNSGSPKLYEHLVALIVLFSFKVGSNALISIIKFSSFRESMKSKYSGDLSCRCEIIIYVVTHFLHPTLLMASLNKEQLQDRKYPILEIIVQVTYSLVQLTIVSICFTIYLIIDQKWITILIMVLGSLDFLIRCLKCLRSTLSPLIDLIKRNQNTQTHITTTHQNQLILNITQGNMEIDVTRIEFNN